MEKEHENEQYGGSQEESIDSNLVQTILKEINEAKDINDNDDDVSSNKHLGMPPMHYTSSNISPEIYKQQQMSFNSQMNPQINPQMNSQMNSQINSQINPQMNPQMNPHLYSQMNPQFNSKSNSQINDPLLNNFTNYNTFFDKTINHLKETIFVICLFVLFNCDYVRASISNTIPSLANDNKNINILGTVLLSIIYGMLYICFRQFV